MNAEPIAIYECHIGSWMRHPGRENEGFYTYREFADALVKYLKKMHFTHVELIFFIPVIKTPDHMHRFRIGSPDCKKHSFFSVFHRQMRPQLFVNIIMRPFRKQIFPICRQVNIRLLRRK